MALALRLGRTLQELMQSMSAVEFGLWQQFDRVSPIGDGRGDLQAAIVASTVANFAGRSLKEGASTKVADFMPYLVRPEPEPEVEADPFEHFKMITGRK